MGYSKLCYEDIDERPEVWLGERGVVLPAWATEMSALGYRGVWAVDFYADVFGNHLEPSRMPEDYQTGEYGAIAVEILDGKKKRTAHRYTVTDGCMELFDLIDRSDNFIIIAPVAYAGKQRKNENARYLFALCVEIDDINPKNGINELFYAFSRDNRPVPRPTYIVCSGNGLHLYYVFERPIPLFKNIFKQLTEAKTYMTKNLWDKQISLSYNNVQYESVCQPFRAVGTTGKDKDKISLAFQTGPKLTIEDFNARLPKKYALNKIYKSDLTRKQAKELYPDWYQRRIVEKQDRGHWNRHEGIYYNWIKKCYDGAMVHHRYYCLENLCSLAVQCEIPPEQVESDVRKLAEYMETLTDSTDNHFGEYDIMCAMRTYEQPTEMAYRRRIEYVSGKTRIPLERALRNGRKQEKHLMGARAIRDINNENWREGNGRKPKKDVVKTWRLEHPKGRKVDCVRDTGLSKPTVLKWWNETD